MNDNGLNRGEDPELGSLFRSYGEQYRERQKLPLYQRKAMYAIENCRTARLGGHIEQCDRCGFRHIFYNSCCNRHCPKCQWLNKEKWLAKQMDNLLPVPYYHVVFTIPDILNPMALVNKEVIYNILFRAAKETPIEFCRDPKHLGAEIGFLAILHTWGQNLMDHPHLHCIVSGGGLSQDRKRWILPRKHTKRKKFFIHVNIISALFKKKFMDYLKASYWKGDLKLVGRISYLSTYKSFRKFKSELYEKKWITYCKSPFGWTEQVLQYLGSYTQRVAISNQRIMKIENGKVTFLWKDYRDGNRKKLMTLDAFEFIRRFLLHILPPRFVKIRQYGIWSNRNKKNKLNLCKALLGVQKTNQTPNELTSWQDLVEEVTGIDLRICPKCGEGRMVRKQTIRPVAHAPPVKIRIAV